MALSINSNIISLNSQRHASSTEAGLARSIQRLSSGLRINTASDDAAGLAISDRMTAGIRGMNQAARNINDGTSLLQVADGAMQQVTEGLQRLRELAVQAGNSIYTDADRASLQQEAVQIMSQITQVGEQTQFNGEAVFSQDRASIGGDANRRAVIDGLKSGWLTGAENLVATYYGLRADGVKLTVNLDTTDGGSGVLASVSGLTNGSGKWSNLHLNLDMADFGPNADGGNASHDRIVAHEMAHAVMARSMHFDAMPWWFREGTAELIHGADDRLRGAVGAGNVHAAAVVGAISGTSYESSYAAMRFLHSKLNDMGVEGGIKGVMTYLNQNLSANLSQALNAVTGGTYADQAAFLADYAANGVAFIGTMNLTNADTGAVGGLDADGGPERTSRSVVPDGSDRSRSDPLAGFIEVFPAQGGNTGTRQVQLQVGAGAGDYITVGLSAMNSAALGLGDLDLRKTSNALSHIDEAIDFVSQQRGVVGASTNRLAAAADNLTIGAESLSASRARIRDTDFAAETASLTRKQILQQAAIAMVTQANSLPNAVLSLLR